MSQHSKPYVGSLELFRIGIGPSSSHTVGPMRAGYNFAAELSTLAGSAPITGVTVTLYGSLGATGPGHGTPSAIVAGLAGLEPETCDPAQVDGAYQRALEAGEIVVAGTPVRFDSDSMVFSPLTRLDQHSNGMRFRAFRGEDILVEAVYFSVGGGFIEKEGEPEVLAELPRAEIPYPFASAAELMALTAQTGLSIGQISRANDAAIHGDGVSKEGLHAIWTTMSECIEAGLVTEGPLPGTLGVNRRAKTMAQKLTDASGDDLHDSDWLQAFAIAVNEENAAGHRVVTAPTNGAAGIVPAVGYWAHRFKGVSSEDIAEIYLPTAAAIGSLYKRNASISGAEAGCQGEVGSACSMAAAGVTAVMGGTPAQIENAAEIAMEHNLGLTCDPVGGYVQMPCIERNAIAAGTAVAAMRLALLGDGSHKISLDTVIETMRQTGIDMSSKYKETSMGGLAVNVIEC
jgi:L-serine dehydratase